MNKTLWDESYAFGLDSIDAEHKRMLEFYEALQTAIEARVGADMLAELLKRTIAYTSEHFRHEEDLFAGTGYPEEELHIADHREMTNRLLDLQRKVTFGATEELALAFQRFLSEWLFNHMQGVDRGYLPYVIEKCKKEQIPT